MTGQGFQYVGDRILPIDDKEIPVGVVPAAVALANLRAAADEHERTRDESPKAEARRAPRRASVSEPVDVIALAKKRRTWLRTEIKRLRKLENELEQLDQLLARPRLAEVKPIKQARQTG